MLAFIRQAFLHGLIFFQRMVFLDVILARRLEPTQKQPFRESLKTGAFRKQAKPLRQNS